MPRAAFGAKRVGGRGREDLFLHKGRGFRLRRAEPDRARPHTLRTQGQRRGDLPAARDPAGVKHRDRRRRIDDLRGQNHRCDIARMAAGLVAGRDDDIHARFHMASDMFRVADHARDLDAVFVAAVGHMRRRHAQGARQQLDPLMAVHDLHPAFRRLMGAHHAAHVFVEDRFTLVRWQFRYLMARHQVLDELAMRFRDEPVDIVDRHPFEFRSGVGREHQIDAVSLAVRMRVEPVQFDLQLFGRYMGRSQDPHAARPADRRDHIAAMRKGEDRCLETEHPHHVRLHLRLHQDRTKHSG